VYKFKRMIITTDRRAAPLLIILCGHKSYSSLLLWILDSNFICC